jgi:hypothetical protein
LRGCIDTSDAVGTMMFQIALVDNVAASSGS